MKFRYILGVLLSAFLLTGCSDDDTAVGKLDTLQLDETFLTIPVTGGSVSVVLTATTDWQFENAFDLDSKNKKVLPVPTWLTASQTSGGAGQHTITFHADASDAGREAMIEILVGGIKQFLVIRQGSLEAAAATCAEVIAGPDSKTYLVTGTVTAIANTTYGNWYLDDGTGQVYIYGTLDKDGKTKNFSSLGIEIGDVVTVSGPKTTYNGTVELVDVTVHKITKALLKVEGTETTVGVEGGDFEVKVAYKGSGAFFDVAEDAKSWVSYLSTKYIAGVKTIFEQNPADTAVFKFNVAPNTGDSRKGVVTFSSYSGKNSTDIVYTIKQDAFTLPHGKNPDDPFTVAEAIKKCQEIGGTSDGEIYYAKGKISSIKEVSTSFGNGTFNISEDGTDNNALTCYRSFFLNNEKFTSEDQIAVGDEVIVCGKLVNYTDKNGVVTPEFSGNVYIYSLKKGVPAGTPGTLDKPFTPAEANAFVKTLEVGAVTTDDYYIKGKIIEITDKNQFGTQYGNCTFYLSDDGTDKDDKFYVFRTLYLGNVKYSDDSWTKPKAGDEVIICGKLMYYKDSKTGNLVPETSANASYIYSLNGKTE